MKRFAKVWSLVLALAMLLAFAGECAAASSAGLDNFYKKQSLYAGTFDDIQWNAEWFFENVKTVYEYDLMTGTSSSTFSPTAKLTLAESITLAARINHIYRYGTALDPNDYGGSTWYDPYVSYARSNGIISSYPNYTAVATRAQFAEILAASVNAEDLKKINSIVVGDIPDVRMSSDYSDEVYLLYRAGILTGSDEYGTFNPDSTISRAEAAAIVTRIVDESLRKSFVLKEKSAAPESSSAYSIPAMLIDADSAKYDPSSTVANRFVFKEDMTCDLTFNMLWGMIDLSGSYEVMATEDGKCVIKVDYETTKLGDGYDRNFTHFYLVETADGWTFYGEGIGNCSMPVYNTVFKAVSSEKTYVTKVTTLQNLSAQLKERSEAAITDGEGYYIVDDYIDTITILDVPTKSAVSFEAFFYRSYGFTVTGALYGDMVFFDEDDYCGVLIFDGPDRVTLELYFGGDYMGYERAGSWSYSYLRRTAEKISQDKDREYLSYLLMNDDRKGWVREDRDVLGGKYDGVFMRFFPNGSMWYIYGEDHAGTVEYEKYTCSYQLENQILYIDGCAYNIDMYSAGSTTMTLKACESYSIDLGGEYWLNADEDYQWMNKYA